MMIIQDVSVFVGITKSENKLTSAMIANEVRFNLQRHNNCGVRVRHQARPLQITLVAVQIEGNYI